MITWKQQGAAVVGAVVLGDGRRGSVALVGPRQNPKGAAIIVKAGGDASVETIPLSEALSSLAPEQVIDIMCMQERVHGASGLPPISEADDAS